MGSPPEAKLSLFSAKTVIGALTEPYVSLLKMTEKLILITLMHEKPHDLKLLIS